MIAALLAAAALAVTASAPAGDRAAAIVARIADPNGGLVVVAHRGCHAAAPAHGLPGAPENSLAALDACVALGADVMETDVRRSRDGVLVMIHDATLDRTTDGHGPVIARTLAQLRALHLRAGMGGPQAALTDQHISTLDEMLARAEAIGAALASAATLAIARGGAALPALKPLVFGHRGASALRPEHTLASYLKAIADGADYVEPDLVPTKDGVLVARHENNIAETTDVAAHPEFAGRRTEKTIDGQRQVGWFTEDLTLAELKTLRAKERLPQLRPANAAMDGQFDVPTFPEIVDAVAAEASARGRTIGLVPELKHSTYFASVGLPLEDRFLALLAAHDFTRRAPVEVQSFEISNLRYLRRRLGRPANIRLLQLVEPSAGQPADAAATGSAATYATMVTPAGLAAVAAYADVLGPPTRAIIPLTPDGRLDRPTSLVADAHRAGLLVRPWTFRPENYFLAADFRSDGGPAARHEAGSVAEIRAYLATGIDGFFTDDPALGRAAIDGGAAVTTAP